MTKTALVVIYNHRFERNIALVERVYRDRFSAIFHLMPFYRGDRANVIPVFGSSHHFQGFIAQAFPRLHRDEFTHYLFIADDLFLNPAIDERNLLDLTGLQAGRCFIPKLSSFHLCDGRTWGKAELAFRWRLHAPGLEPAGSMPSYDDAIARFRRHGLEIRPARFDQVWRVPRTWREWIRRASTDPVFCARYLYARLARRTYTLDYPLVGGYSDVCVVTSDAIRDFAHHCGVLAASGLFVEHAIPTAMALSAPAITVQSELRLQGKALWTREELQQLDAFGGSVRALVDGFPKELLYLHPIKLSKWLMDLDVRSVDRIDPASIIAIGGCRNQVTDLRLEDGALCLTATGEDPYLHLPEMEVDPGRTASIVVEVTVPSNCVVEIFYESPGDERLTPEKSVSWNVGAGRHRLVRQIAHPINGRLRIDPGNVRGEYRIHRIEIHQ